MTVPHFPRLLLRERSHSWNLVGVAATPGQTARSVAPIIRSDGGGFWSCKMADVSLSGGLPTSVNRERQRLSTLLWRAVRQVCDGGVNQIIVPRNDALFRPWPTGLAQGNPDILHSDSSPFSDAVGYYQSVIDVVTYADADLRDTVIGLTLNYCGPLVGGESFSIEHETIGWRLYEIATVNYSDDTHAAVTFLPPLREAVPLGTAIEFDRPRCMMRLAQPGSMDLSVNPWTFNSASVDFVEAFT